MQTNHKFFKATKIKLSLNIATKQMLLKIIMLVFYINKKEEKIARKVITIIIEW